MEDHAGATFRLHRQWMAAARGDAVASVPIRSNGKIYAIVSMRRRTEQAIDRSDLEEIRSRIEPFVPVFNLSSRASRSLAGHLGESAVDLFFPRGGFGTIRNRLMALLLLAGLAWCVFGKMDYRIVAPCTVTPGEVRHVTMPMDGVLLEADLKPGDRVVKGQVLCRVDDRELTEERAALSSELAMLSLESDRAMADHEPANVQVIGAKMKLIETRLDILDRRIEQAVIRAGIDGVIVGGDPRKSVGGVLPKGQPLVEVAPLDRLIVEVEVPEGKVDEIEAGLTGHFVPYARPELRNALTIRRIHPRAEAHDGKNVFRTEAEADLTFDWIKPGMEGTAMIPLGRRPVWRVVLDRPIDYIRFNWLP